MKYKEWHIIREKGQAWVHLGWELGIERVWTEKVKYHRLPRGSRTWVESQRSAFFSWWAMFNSWHSSIALWTLVVIESSIHQPNISLVPVKCSKCHRRFFFFFFPKERFQDKVLALNYFFLTESNHGLNDSFESLVRLIIWSPLQTQIWYFIGEARSAGKQRRRATFRVLTWPNSSFDNLKRKHSIVGHSPTLEGSLETIHCFSCSLCPHLLSPIFTGCNHRLSWFSSSSYISLYIRNP